MLLQIVQDMLTLIGGIVVAYFIYVFLRRKNDKPAADTPTMAHAALRDLVERAVEEARKLPNLGSSDAGRSADPRDISEQTYEDLLATAILNKVIEKYQIEHVDGNSNTLHSSRTSLRPKYITSEIEVGLDEGVEEGSSSLEPLSQDEYSSDCSAPAPKYSLARQEPLSLTIEEHIEEVTTTYTSDEEERDTGEANGLDFRNAHRVPFPEFGMDIIDPSQESSEETQDEAITPTHVDLVTPIESWEENWLFQKKKMQAQSEPVSMLVPNPSEDFRPLIGDRDADDTSDLSDCSAQSDEEIEDELLEAINNVVLKTPESPEANKVKEIVEVRSQITNNGKHIEEIKTRTELGNTTISIRQDNVVENPMTDSLIKEGGAIKVGNFEKNGNNEEKRKGEPLASPPIKLGIEDMLVFHLKDNRTSKHEHQMKKHQNHSIEFIEKEKSSVHLDSRDENTDDIEVELRRPTKRVESSRVTVKIARRSETRNLPINTDSLTSDSEKTLDSLQFVEPEIETNVSRKEDVELSQFTRDVKFPVDRTNVNVMEDMKPPRFSRDLELPVDRTNVSVIEDMKPLQFTRDVILSVDRVNVNVEDDEKPPQFTRDLILPVDRTNVNVEEDMEPLQFTREVKLPVDGTNASVIEDSKPLQFTRDLKLPVDETNANFEEDIKPLQFTRDIKLPVDETNENVEEAMKPLQFTRDIKLPVDETNEHVEEVMKPLQFTRDIKLPVDETNEHVEEVMKPLQFTRDIKLPVDETNDNVEEDMKPLQFTRDLKLPVDETNGNVEDELKPLQFTRDLKLPVDRTSVNLEENLKPSQLTRELKLVVDESIVNVENGVKLAQLTRDIKPFVDETNFYVEDSVKLAEVTRELRPVDGTEVLKVDNNLQGHSYDANPVLELVAQPNLPDDQAVEDLDLDSGDKDDFVNLDDDLETKEVPRTPTSSPLRLETVNSETGIDIDLHSLDEKLVSVETRTDTKLNSLNEMLHSYVQKTEGDVRRALDSVSNNLAEFDEDGVVEARLIFVGSSDHHSQIVRTELHGIDLQNEDGAQQESEYTEHYATATQRHLDSLTRSGKGVQIKEIDEAADHHHDDIPPPIPSTPPPVARLRQCRKAAALATVEFEVNPETQAADRKRVEVDLLLATPPRPGTIAEREHKKWENAAPIENNPYSEENIQKRLWQRQYSRKLSSDASVGENSEAPKMSGGSMQVVLGAGQPDVKRYGRDYYINDAKRSSGERVRRSAMLNAGSRNSSMSQNSSSYDDDLEQQVSYGLDRFEEASLRGSLNRRSFRGQNSSPHFVTNPLLHLQVGEDCKIAQVADELGDRYVSDSVKNESQNSASSDRDKAALLHKVQDRNIVLKDTHKSMKCSSKGDQTVPRNEASSEYGELKIEDNEIDHTEKNYENRTSSEKLGSISDLMIEGYDTKFEGLDEERKLVVLEPENFQRLFKAGDGLKKFAVNPLYNLEDNFLLVDVNRGANFVDRDSGMYSIDSNDVTESGKIRMIGNGEEEVPKRLSVDESKEYTESQIVTSNGKRYSDFGSFKFHTFGGIKRRRFNWNDLKDEYDETDSDNEEMFEYPENISDFGSLKCQTFGGIKQKAKFDGKKIAKYHKVKLRPALLFKDAKAIGYTEPTRAESKKGSLHCSNFETRRDPNYTKFKDLRLNSTGERSRRKNTSRETVAERNVGDENLMAIFLRDALMRPKSRLSTDNESIYSLDTTTRRSHSFRGDSYRNQNKHFLARDDSSLRLEPPRSPEVIQKSFETLAGLRRTRSLKGDKTSILSGGSSLRRKFSKDISMW